MPRFVPPRSVRQSRGFSLATPTEVARSFQALPSLCRLFHLLIRLPFVFSGLFW
jgi:hypothetical protein